LKRKNTKFRQKFHFRFFSAFVYLFEGGRIGLYEATLESFRLLAAEFGFESLSSACSLFSTSNGGFCVFSSDTGVSEGESGGIETSPSVRPRVRITYGDRLHTYEVLASLRQAREFGIFLSKANEEDIVIDGVKDRDRLVEKAVATVYFNTVASLPDDNGKEPFLALILWETHYRIKDCSIDTVIYCFNLLNVIAPTAFNKAKLLILSQCDPSRSDDFVPLLAADWAIIGQGIRILAAEKNGKTKEARELLQKLRATGLYKSNPMIADGVWSLEPYSMLTAIQNVDRPVKSDTGRSRCCVF
jgi:hypothetical protein